MPWCPQCGKELPALSSICQNCSDEPAAAPAFASPRKPCSNVQKVLLHVMPMSIKSCLLGWAVVGFFFSFTVCMCEHDGSRAYPLSLVGLAMVLISVIGFVQARGDREYLMPIHIALGSAIIPAMLVIIFAAKLGPLSQWSQTDSADVALGLFATPAAAVVGMIRGVRARGQKTASPLLWCMILIAGCCVSAWWLSFTPVGRVFTVPRPGHYSRHYTPPQLDTADATPSASGGVVRDHTRSTRD